MVASGNARSALRQSPDVIWKTITDVAAMPAWRQGLKGVNRLLDKNERPAWVDSETIPLRNHGLRRPSKLVLRNADSQPSFGGTRA